MKRQAYFDIAFIYRPAIFKKKPIYLKYSKKKSTDGNPKIGKNYIPKKKMRKFPRKNNSVEPYTNYSRYDFVKDEIPKIGKNYIPKKKMRKFP